MIPETNKWQVGDVLKVVQGCEVHYERVIQLLPEILTVDMNKDAEGEISTQGLSDASGITYEVVPNHKIANVLKNWIPKGVAYSIANRFYGSDYNMADSTFENALKDLGY